ncbi:DUF2130 domain-containing protein [Spiroplasma endosymbiont of Cantharis nigra]|uniref:DUF2130 domain-containing protein n=1 Tax=Spiroplasma endosymbiont of Cantharis nigra TaxID=3066278 RepID=UPI0030D1529F
MEFKIICPHCKKSITKEDFASDEHSILELQKYFKSEEEEFKNKLKKELIGEFNENSRRLILEKEKEISDKKIGEIKKIEDEHKKVIDKLQEDLKKLEIEKETFDKKTKLLIKDKELEVTKQKQEEIDKLKDELKDFETKIKTNEGDLKNKILEKEKEISDKKIGEIKKIEDEHKKVIDKLQEDLKKLEIEKETFDKKTKFLIKDKELEITKQKQEEIDTLKDKLKDFETKIKINEGDLKNKILEKEKEFSDKKIGEIKNIEDEHKKVIDKLREDLKKLEIENSKFRIIPPKTMGENFEKEFKSAIKEIFLNDNIVKITSGNKRADFKQEIFESEKHIGQIIYEVKAGENWDDKWISKFEEDIISKSAKYGVLVANSFRTKFLDVPFEKIPGKNIFVTDYTSFSFVAHILRILIIKEHTLSLNSENSEFREKMTNFIEWRDQKFSQIVSAIIKNSDLIVTSASNLEKIKKDIIDSANIIKENIINKIQVELDTLI